MYPVCMASMALDDRWCGLSRRGRRAHSEEVFSCEELRLLGSIVGSQSARGLDSVGDPCHN